MRKMSDVLRQVAARVLQSGQVDMVLGYTRGPKAYQSIPYVATSPEEAANLCFGATSNMPLAKYLLQDSFQGKKVALVVKGCDYRAVKLMLGENRIEREHVYLIGVECPGMLSESRAGDQPKLSPFCRSCMYNTPPKDEVDVLVTELREADACSERETESKKQAFPEIEAIENMSEEERFAYWKLQLNRCKRCNACRNACPVCTCRACMFDRETPGFLDAAKDQLAQHQFYHIIRAFHVSDRCVGCGVCSRVCPEGIPLHLLHQKLERELQRFYGSYTPGIDQLPTPLSHAHANEPDFFGKGGK